MKSKKEILDEAIVLLENKQALELKLLKEQFHTTYESLKPINLIKSTFQEVNASPDIKKDILNTAVGLATGYLSKKVLANDTSSSGAPIKKMIGTLLQFALAKIVSKNSDSIISSGEGLLQRLVQNKNNVKQEFSNN